MNINELIDIVVKEVMKKIQQNLLKVLVVSKDDTWDIKLNKIPVSFDRINLYNEGIPLENFDCVVIDRFSNIDLVASALLLPITENAKLILKSISKDKLIYINRDGIEFKRNLGNYGNNILNRLEIYENDIVNYGVKILTSDEILIGIEESTKLKTNSDIKSTYNNKYKSNDLYEINKKLVTEKNLLNAYQNGYKNVKIKNSSIITPLAKDFIKDNNITIYID